MREYEYYDWGGSQRLEKFKQTKFRNQSSRRSKNKTISEKRTQYVQKVPRKHSLLDMPDEPCLDLMTESGFPLNLLSSHAVHMLERFFEQTISASEIGNEDIKRWYKGEQVQALRKASGQLKGKVFEEIITREFVQTNPEYFVTNPVLTSKIINPVLNRLGSGLVLPDHLVFKKTPPRPILVGFMEDKKAIDLNSEDIIFEQLESEWALFNLIVENSDAQSQFRREMQEHIPSLPFKIEVSPIDKGLIWLATTKEAVREVGQLPNWASLFVSSVSQEAINKLSEKFISRRFLPNMFPDLAKSSGGN